MGVQPPGQSPITIGAGQSTTATIVNGDSEGATLRFDTAGNAIDAHDGEIVQFGDTYYLYGTSYGCGFNWQQAGTPFCGFSVYTSTDLTHWHYAGPLFDANTPTWQQRCDGSTSGCFRPHVVYNAWTHRYVLWINSSDNTVDYHVFTSLSPTGPFVEQPAPWLGLNSTSTSAGGNNGDESLFVDTDGTAYLAFTDWDGGGDIVVEQLNRSYLSGTGHYVLLNTRSTEAPSLFKRGSTYYMTYSDPNCGYCAGTGTSYMTAPSPLGPWTGSGVVPDAWQIVNGMLKVTGGDIGLSNAGADWTNYTMSFDTVPLETGDGGTYAQAGWVFRAQNTTSGYAWLLGNYPYPGAESGSLTKVVFDNGTVVSDTVVPLPFPVVAGDTYAVSTTVSGSTITTTINGVLVDTTTDTTFTSGKVGFRESSSDGESALFSNLLVTAPDGTVLLADNFSSGLGNWDRPAPVALGTSISSNSCGGQPDNVATLTGPNGPVYLYQSDRWDGADNEALATQFWEPLQFNADGSIQPLTCADSYQVQLSAPYPARPTLPAGNGDTGFDSGSGDTGFGIGSGDTGFHSYCDIGGNIERAQTFTATRSGVLSEIAYTTYQDGYPNAPLTLSLEQLGATGLPDGVVATQNVPASEVSWAPSWVYLRAPIRVEKGEQLALVLSSSTTQGCYGLAYNDSNPYAGGGEFYSNSGGQSWSAEAGRALHFRVLIGWPWQRAGNPFASIR